LLLPSQTLLVLGVRLLILDLLLGLLQPLVNMVC
jgi:hypothetical protein